VTAKTYAEHARDVLVESGYTSVMWGDAWLLDAIGTRCGLPRMHPLNRHKRILDALERSPLFTKGYVRLDVFTNNQSRLVRSFKLVEASQ
jgi:hypothetical protein